MAVIFLFWMVFHIFNILALCFCVELMVNNLKSSKFYFIPLVILVVLILNLTFSLINGLWNAAPWIPRLPEIFFKK
jgi:Sec-independent protein secretion pathway component TatC